MHNNVNHPYHYQASNGIECIDAIRAATENLYGVDAFCVGNAIKYLWRCNKKGSATEDLNKAVWYISY